MDVIDWIFYFLGKTVLKMFRLQVSNKSDAGITVLGFFAFLFIAIIIFVIWGLFQNQT
jgi:hypothetical protein